MGAVAVPFALDLSICTGEGKACSAGIFCSGSLVLSLSLLFLRTHPIAPAYRDGVKSAITATCHLHTVEGRRCNKNLTLGPHLDVEQATLLIKEWCVRGFLIPDGDEARIGHMTTWGPRNFAPDEVRSLAELDALAGAGDA